MGIEKLGRRIIIVADSVMELIQSIQLRRTILKEAEVDMIMTNQSNRSELFFENLTKLGCFSKIYFIYSKRFPFSYSKNGARAFDNEDEYLLLMSELLPETDYDGFITSELDLFSRTVYAYLKRRNGSVNAYLLSETFGALVENGPVKIGIERRLRAADTKFRDLLIDFKGILTDGIRECEATYEDVVVYPRVNPEDSGFITLINKTFGYYPGKEVIHNKVIFFEEAFFQDGGSVNDIELLEELGKKFGKELFLVKRHPRSEKNRFQNLGYMLMEHSYIPWEIVLLNGDCRNCLFISVFSSSMYIPKTYDWYDGKMVILSELAKYERLPQVQATHGGLFNYLRNRILVGNDYYKPESMNELFEMVKLGLKENGVI